MSFPREVWAGSHLTKESILRRQVINNEEGFLNWVRNFNNKMNCYTSVYNYRRFSDSQAIITSIILDRLFLDFDAHGKPLKLSFEDMKIVVDYLRKTDYKFDMYFSGNGFHIFIYGEITDSIRNIQQFFRIIHGLTINGTLDKSGVQTRRLRRIPNTVNMNTKEYLYCVPLKLEHLDSLDTIIEEAKNPSFSSPVTYGKKIIDWPTAPPIHTAPIEVRSIRKGKRLPILPCLENSIMVENPTHQARYYLVSWYRTILADNKLNFNEEQNREILETVIDEIKAIAANDGVWLDWNEEVTRFHAWYTINNNGGYMAPNCEKLISEGFCIGKCWRYPELEVKE